MKIRCDHCKRRTFNLTLTKWGWICGKCKRKLEFEDYEDDIELYPDERMREEFWR